MVISDRKSHRKASPIKIVNTVRSSNVLLPNDLYCSSECKKKCSTFNKQKYPEGFKRYTEQRWGHHTWANLIKERDNDTCQKCGTQEKTMYAHHIIPYSACKFMYLDPPNGITLCKSCHKEVHKKDGCTLKYLKKFRRCNANKKNKGI